MTEREKNLEDVNRQLKETIAQLQKEYGELQERFTEHLNKTWVVESSGGKNA